MSHEDEVVGGYLWRKYGEKTVGVKKKAIKRSYYRCVCVKSSGQCAAKKRVDRLVCASPDAPPISVVFVNRHSRYGGPSQGSDGDGETETCGRRALENMRAEELASEMYKDLVAQLELSRGRSSPLRSPDDGKDQTGAIEGPQQQQTSHSKSSGFAGEDLHEEMQTGSGTSNQDDCTLIDSLLEQSYGEETSIWPSVAPCNLQESRDEEQGTAFIQQDTLLPALQEWSTSGVDQTVDMANKAQPLEKPNRQPLWSRPSADTSVALYSYQQLATMNSFLSNVAGRQQVFESTREDGSSIDSGTLLRHFLEKESSSKVTGLGSSKDLQSLLDIVRQELCWERDAQVIDVGSPGPGT